MTYGVVRGMQKVIYGPLRAIEREQLWDKAWYAVTETALAMTTFRDEVGMWFFVMFVALLAGKVWQWISEARVEALEQQPPTNPRLVHARLISSLVISDAFDLLMLRYCVNTLLEQPRPGMMVMFAFEFAVLAISSTSTAAKYVLSLVEGAIIKRQTKARIAERREELRLDREQAAREASDGGETSVPAAQPVEEEIDEAEIDVPGWQEKGRWSLFLDLLTGESTNTRNPNPVLMSKQISSNYSSTCVSSRYCSCSMAYLYTSFATFSSLHGLSSSASQTSSGIVTRHEI